VVLRAAVSDIRRLRKIAGVLTRHGFDEVATRVWRKAAPDADPAELGEAPTEAAKATPPERRFRLVLEELGPTFIKLGQVLSTRPDLLPRKFIKELAGLQDQVEPVPTEDIRRQIEKALGRPVSEAFDRFEDKPLATASIGQTHVGWLDDGTKVAIKVQRPGIGNTIRSDLDLLRAFAGMLVATVEEARLYNPVGIAAEFEKAITEELDFRLELSRMEEFHQNFLDSDSVIIPAPFSELSARTVLTMEFMEGQSLSSIAPEGHDREKIANALMDGWFQMVFQDGLFHADPHPGNLQVLAGDRLAVLDFGLVGHISAQTQDTLVALAVGIFLKDVAGVARVLYKVGAPDTRVPLAAFRQEIQGLIDKYLGLDLDAVDTGSLLSELLDVAVRYQIRVPPEYALLAKAGATLEGVIRDLVPDLNIYETAQPYVRRLISERYAPDRLMGQLLRVGMGFSSFLQDVPGQLDQVLMDLEGGKLQVQVENPSFTDLGYWFNSLASRVFMGIFSGACLISAAILLAPYQESLVRGPALGIIALLGSLALGWTAITWHVAARNKGKKIRLTDWIAFWRRMRRRGGEG
jgi:ubiquinone biosynthesis protein